MAIWSHHDIEPLSTDHYDVIKWTHFPRYWPFVRGMNSPHKGQWRGALMFSFICAWTNGWANNREAGDLRRYRAHYDPAIMNIGIGEVDMFVNDRTCSVKNWDNSPCPWLVKIGSFLSTVAFILPTRPVIFNWYSLTQFMSKCQSSRGGG